MEDVVVSTLVFVAIELSKNTPKLICDGEIICENILIRVIHCTRMLFTLAMQVVCVSDNK